MRPSLTPVGDMMVQTAGWYEYIDPNVRMLSSQVKSSEAMMSPRTISVTIHLSAQEPRRMSGKSPPTTTNRHSQSEAPLAV
jgi:hypothetical protein